MAQLVLTVVGDDRAGLVKALAEVVSDHDGNWERSELAELAGAFAGIVLVSVPDEREAALTAALHELDGLLRITAHSGLAASDGRGDAETITFSVLGNDRPGIVREVTAALERNGFTIDRFTSQTREAPMAGGTLFEASVQARATQAADRERATSDLEQLAHEIQVELTVA
ncbi:glycine cleavage system protein R [Microbacterium sp. NIBRBAC000506063]|uniref:glycine cleavage system protein R n=1 Tax=Microbacterium sp. NIBRBAC000506063 TaxID=2734618 RepID=UPI001BB54109|nr:ACT domain-containing protein [Microbacterium sp. NIBRBAC000506063]QTV79740.1 amino acid-binding ACT protein [Microbacterium sp. NIBRBAC000506063]